MSVADTKPEKTCSNCGVVKIAKLFIPKRNICKECRNKRSREKYNSIDISNKEEKSCNICNQTKHHNMFVKNRNTCIDRNNLKRRTKYHTDDTQRSKIIQASTIFKQKIITEKHKQK